MRDYLTVCEAAKILEVGEASVRKYIKSKRLAAEWFAAGKHGIYLIKKGDLLEFKIMRMQKNRLPMFE